MENESLSIRIDRLENSNNKRFDSIEAKLDDLISKFSESISEVKIDLARLEKDTDEQENKLAAVWTKIDKHAGEIKIIEQNHEGVKLTLKTLVALVGFFFTLVTVIVAIIGLYYKNGS